MNNQHVQRAKERVSHFGADARSYVSRVAVKALLNLFAFVLSALNGRGAAPAELNMPLVDWREDGGEWYVRSDAVMSPAHCLSAETQEYQFTIWVNSEKLAQAVTKMPCIKGWSTFGPGYWDEIHFMVSFIVLAKGEWAWEELSAMLDEVMLGDVWGDAIAEVDRMFRMREANYKGGQNE